MTLVSDLLNFSPRFLRSVNLERDFSDAQALDGYLTTPEIVSHLKQFANGLRRESGQRAWYITGDFGSGKSSFALVLANLMARRPSEIPRSVRELGSVLGLPRNSARVLPVLVTGSREPMSLAVLRGLAASLRNGLHHRAKSSAREKATKLLTTRDFQDRDIVALIDEASEELQSAGKYGGILLIIDELGKFLEFAALNPDAQDVFFLQSLAEAAARSQSAPIHVVGLLHQGIAEYAEKLSITAQREWAKVGERFGSIRFSQPLGQTATLISAALQVDHDDASLWGWKTVAKEAMADAISMGLYGPAPGKTELLRLAPLLYPLHPTVIPILTRFFRRFGQNERSLFSFLLSSEPYGLRAFAECPADPKTTFDLANFYDFAAYNFADRLGAQSFRSHWSHIDAVVRGASAEDETTQRILKTVGILNVLQEPDLHPTLDMISLALGHPSGLKSRLTKLCQRGILFHRGQLAGYSLWPSASVNLEQRFIAAKEAISHSGPISSTLRERLDNRPVVARRHYIQTGNLRYFEVRYLTVAEFVDASDTLRPRYPADGTLVVVLCESVAEQTEAAATAAMLAAEDQVLIAISPPLESLASYSLNIDHWQWVERNTPELKDDRFAAEEVGRQIAAATQALETRIQEFIGFRGEATHQLTGDGVSWVYRGSNVPALRKKEKSLQEFLSALCDDLFSQAPQVRNELVNRHSLSSSAAAARQRLFECVLHRAGEPLLGLPEDRYPPEKSIYLSLLAAGCLHRQSRGVWKIDLPEEGADPLNLRPALNAVVEKLEEISDRRVPLTEIYDLLHSPPFGVRDGLIPLLLLVIHTVYEAELAIYEDNVFQPEIEENLWMRLARRSETFEFQLCRISGVRKALIAELAAVVDADRAESSHLLSIVRPLYLFVAGLPDYARNTDQLSPDTLALRKAIDAAREPADLVFHEIPRVFGFSGKGKAKLDAAALASRLGQAITELRRCFPELQNRMARAVLDAFRYEGSLEEWRESISDPAETILVGLGDPEFRAFCLKLIDTENPESEWLEALGSLLTRVPPSRWKDRDELVFRERIEAFARQFERVHATCFTKDGAASETAIRIAVTPRSGVEKDLVLNLNAVQARETEDLIKKLRDQLPCDNPNVALAVLSRLIWDQIRNES